MGMTPAERQRRYRERKVAQGYAGPCVPCACGCGTAIPAVTKTGKLARFKHGHNARVEPIGQRFAAGQEAWNKGRPAPWTIAAHRGKRLTVEQLAHRQATRSARLGGLYQVKRGWKHRPETIERMRAASRAHARYGALNHAWEGGRAFLPSSPTFNLRVKRAVLRRDGYTCQDCGTGIERRKGARKANIHHVDFDKHQSTEDNLVALCVSCHHKRHWKARRQVAPGQ